MTSSKVSPGMVITGSVAAVALLAILVISFVSMRRAARYELCAGNLRILYMAIGAGELFDSPKWDEAGTGRSFFANYEKWPTRQRRDFSLSCPVKDKLEDIDYRGPARSLRLMKTEEPILADREGNHGPGQGGNVALKDGRIFAARPQDALWERAARSTSD